RAEGQVREQPEAEQGRNQRDDQEYQRQAKQTASLREIAKHTALLRVGAHLVVDPAVRAASASAGGRSRPQHQEARLAPKLECPQERAKLCEERNCPPSSRRQSGITAAP